MTSVHGHYVPGGGRFAAAWTWGWGAGRWQDGLLGWAGRRGWSAARAPRARLRQRAGPWGALGWLGQPVRAHSNLCYLLVRVGLVRLVVVHRFRAVYNIIIFVLVNISNAIRAPGNLIQSRSQDQFCVY